MKNLLKKAMASVVISSTFVAPMTMNICADEVQTQITTANDFVNILLSVQSIENGQTKYVPFIVVDDGNYTAIVNSESVYQTLSKEG